MEMRRYTILGTAATTVIALTSAMRAWPFPNLSSEPWLFQLSTHSHLLRYIFLLIFYAAVALLSWCWYKFCQHSRDTEMTTRQVVVTFICWAAPLMLATPLFSGDVYVYWADGQLLLRGFDPYSSGVSALGSTPMVYMIHPLWRSTTTMYGPLFVRVAQGAASVTPNSVIAGVLIFRVLTLGAITLMAFSLRSILRTIARPIPQGFVFALLNPITLLHLVGGVHNDAMMLGFLFAGLAVGLKAESVPMRFAALALCAAAGTFKIPGFAGALVLGWIWAGEDVAVLRRIAGAAIAGIGGLFAFELITLATGMGWGWVNAAGVPGLAHPLLAPPNALAFSFGSVFGNGLGVNTVTRSLAELAAVIFATVLILRTGRRATPEATLRAFAWGLLAIAWTGPAVYPWYLAWGVALAGAVGLRSMRTPLILGTIGVNFLVAPGGYGFLDLYSDWRRTVMAFLTVAAFTAIAVHLYKRARAAGYLPARGPNWSAYSAAVRESPSLISPLRMKVRS